MNTARFKLADPLVFWIALALSTVGVLMAFDSMYSQSIARGNGVVPPEFRSQILPFLLAPAVFFLLSWVSADWFNKIAWPFAVVVSVLLVAAMVPGLRYARNGAERWVKLGPVIVQPSEFAKLAIILLLAFVLAQPTPKTEAKRQQNALMTIFSLLLVLVSVFWIDKEPDLGTAVIAGVCAVSAYWIAGVNAKVFAAGLALVAIAIFYFVQTEPYRLQRFIDHVHRWEPEKIRGSGFQSDIGSAALVSGGLTGRGLGQGIEKRRMPEASSDFVMATVGEESGLVGTIIIFGAMGFMVVRLAKSSSELAQGGDRYGAIVVGSVAAWIGFQGCLNLVQANGTIPPVGVPFPFVSSGGSSLLALWMSLGICEAVLKRRPRPVLEQRSVEVLA